MTRDIREHLVRERSRRLLLELLDREPVDPEVVLGDAEGDRGQRDAVEFGRDRLPELEECGIVEWDRETNAVVRGPEFDRARPTLELLARQREQLLDDEAARAELRRRNDRLEKFASVASHDLRNPLTSALSSIELARERNGDTAELAEAREALDRAFSVVDDALAFARIRRGEADGQRVPLPRVLEETWAMVETGDCELRLDDDLGTVEADPDPLKRLFENLFRNAAEHAAEDDGATVRVGRLDDRDGFYVADDGPGIPADERDRVFEYGVTTSETGSGLGLATVDEIAAAHDWKVRATESEAGGARFEFAGPELATGRSVVPEES